MEQPVAKANRYHSPENQRFAELLHGAVEYSLDLARKIEPFTARAVQNPVHCKLIFDINKQLTDAQFRGETIHGHKDLGDPTNVFDIANRRWGHRLSGFPVIDLERKQYSIAAGQGETERLNILFSGKSRRDFLASSTGSDPSSVLSLFASGVKNAVQAASLLAETLSEPVQDYLRASYDNVNDPIGTAIGKQLIADQDSAAFEQLQLSLLTGSFADDLRTANRAQGITVSACHSVIRRQRNGYITLPIAFKAIKPFIAADLFKGQTLDHFMFSNGAKAPFDEFLLQRLIDRPVEISEAKN